MVAAVDQLDFSNKLQYALWLAQAYYLVRHSTPLLAICCGRAIENRRFHLRCISHLGEEKGHDRLLLNDLKQLGYSIQQFPEFASTSAFYQTQYFWIEHVNPVSFLGYIYVLEALAVGRGEKKAHEARAFHADSFLKLHASEDTGHLEHAMELVKSFSEEDQRQILKNANQSASIYQAIVSDIVAYTAKVHTQDDVSAA